MLPAPPRPAAEPASVPERCRRAWLLAEGHPLDGSRLAHTLARDRIPGARGPSRERPSPRRSPGHARLARQPGQLRDPRLDREAARTVAADVRLHRYRSRREDDLGRDPGPRPALSDGAPAPRRPRLSRRPPASAASRSGSRSCPSTTSPTRARWVEKVSKAVGSTVPDLISWEWSKGARQGRARLDYTQNASIKTLVAPYSVRPAPGAPVSAPITWDELDDPALRPNRWTDPDHPRPRRRGRRPLRRRPDRRPGAPRGLSGPVSTAAAVPGTSGSPEHSTWPRPHRVRWPSRQ